MLDIFGEFAAGRRRVDGASTDDRRGVDGDALPTIGVDTAASRPPEIGLPTRARPIVGARVETMNRCVLSFASLGLVACLGGCTTTLQGTAPAREGYVYAVGSKNNQPAAWVCPVPKSGPCQPIKIITEDD
jgi:hypothetical protein